MSQPTKVASSKVLSSSGPMPAPRRADAEASLRLVRRRYWTIRRVAFTIAYRGIFIFLVLAPWVVVGLTLWKTGAIAVLWRARVPTAAVQSVQPILDDQPAASRPPQTWVISEDAATHWVREVLQTYPAVQHPQVVFRSAGAEIRGAVGPSAQPIEVVIGLTVSVNRIGGVIRQVTLGGITGGSSETVVRPLLDPLITRTAADFNRQYTFSSVAVEGNTLRVIGAVR